MPEPRSFGEPPSETQHFVLLYKRIRMAIDGEQIDQYPESLIDEDAPFQVFSRTGRPAAVVFRAGDEIPRDIGFKVYRSFADRIACLSESEDRLDEPTQSERRNFFREADDALRKFRNGDSVRFDNPTVEELLDNNIEGVWDWLETGDFDDSLDEIAESESEGKDRVSVHRLIEKRRNSKE